LKDENKPLNYHKKSTIALSMGGEISQVHRTEIADISVNYLKRFSKNVMFLSWHFL
jgi:hypothetical protein